MSDAIQYRRGWVLLLLSLVDEIEQKSKIIL